ARAGEGFLFGALLVMLASVLRYGAMRLHEDLQSHPLAQVAFIRGAGGLVTALFGMAMWIVVSSVRHLAAALEARSLESVATLSTEHAALKHEEREIHAKRENQPLERTDRTAVASRAHAAGRRSGTTATAARNHDVPRPAGAILWGGPIAGLLRS